ncbi:NUDIX hydrolase [Clostridium sp. MSJ-11]|uniref:NUDIX hydrolase n=1 Tax=Clostridium mobile TaxID=2841512 RepID=A0ABS6EI49_9CLOT|nr:NUDIX hydrolase [Clostridium mobile]MBU5484919.1 NUDIX hydrolase [Clostridium mobile]
MEGKLLYDGWLKLFKKRVGDREYEIVKNHDAVSALVINEFDEILLVKQFRPSIMKETLEIPAGIIDVEGESIEDCLIRELWEETALVIEKNDISKIISYKPILGFSSSTMHMFKVKISKASFIPENIRDEDVLDGRWVTIDELEDLIKKEIIVDDKTIMAFYYFKSSNT